MDLALHGRLAFGLHGKAGNWRDETWAEWVGKQTEHRAMDI